MRLKPPRMQAGFRRAPAAARGARICAKRSSLVDPTAVVGERRLFDAQSEDASDGLGSRIANGAIELSAWNLPPNLTKLVSRRRRQWSRPQHGTGGGSVGSYQHN